MFGVYTDKGYTWRYISNDRIKFHKLEKIINKDLHLDSDEEKGKRIQKMIDAAQDSQIDENKTAIEILKKSFEESLYN